MHRNGSSAPRSRVYNCARQPAYTPGVSALEQRNLGRSGLIVSAVGLGCNNFGGRMDMAATRAIVHQALDLGVTFFDTSDTYGERGGAGGDLRRAPGRKGPDIVLPAQIAPPMGPEGGAPGAPPPHLM